MEEKQDIAPKGKFIDDIQDWFKQKSKFWLVISILIFSSVLFLQVTLNFASHVDPSVLAVRGTDFVLISDNNTKTSTTYLMQGSIAIPPNATNSHNAPSMLTIDDVGKISSAPLSQGTWNTKISKFPFVAGNLSNTTLTSKVISTVPEFGPMVGIISICSIIGMIMVSKLSAL
jgi:hypothetical protein